MCTDREYALNQNNCNTSAIAEGQCCPEGAIPCNDESQEYKCRASPYYGENQGLWYECKIHQLRIWSQGKSCPADQPIPCSGDLFCTNKSIILNLHHCESESYSDQNGWCCPSDAIDCKNNDPYHYCRANLEHGGSILPKSWKCIWTIYTSLVQLCPTSHPISCASGSKCTNLQQLLASPCKRFNITDGNCCPSDSILCNDNDATKICMSNPEYGKQNF